jgi:hypothetical protein
MSSKSFCIRASGWGVCVHMVLTSFLDGPISGTSERVGKWSKENPIMYFTRLLLGSSLDDSCVRHWACLENNTGDYTRHYSNCCFANIFPGWLRHVPTSGDSVWASVWPEELGQLDHHLFSKAPVKHSWVCSGTAPSAGRSHSAPSAQAFICTWPASVQQSTRKPFPFKIMSPEIWFCLL